MSIRVAAEMLSVWQYELISGVVGERAKEQRDVNLRGDRRAAVDVGRDVEGVRDVVGAVEAA